MELGLFFALHVPFLGSTMLKRGTRMLETLVSSRIRRTLFEYVLSHHADRFYLRGIAKELNLSVSPLRRELKRLEHSGMLKADQEGNILFYTVNVDSPAFLQLQQVVRSLDSAHDVQPLASFVLSSTVVPYAAPQKTEAPSTAGSDPKGSDPGRSPGRSFWSAPLPIPALLGAAGVGMGLLVILTSLLYMSLTNQQLASRTLATRKAEVTVVVPQHSSSGAMRGARWQVIPGGFGGFSSSTTAESF